MKRLLVLLIICILFQSFLSAQNCSYPDKIKVLLVGDSWGNFMWAYRNYKESFIKFGYPDYLEYAASTVENGAEAEDYIVNPKLNNVITALNSNSDIEYVLISLGGNDVLGDWHKDFTQAQNDSLLDTLQARLDILIDTIKQTKQGVQILISGYDYPNFGETCYLVPTGAYADLYADMGSPSFVEMNGALIRLIERFSLMAQNDPQLNIVSNLGLMQYMFGQSTNLIVSPYLPSYPPYSVPIPGGNPNYPSPRAAMLANIDAFHLNQNAFQHFSNRHTEEFFWKEFRKDKDTSFYSNANQLDAFIDYNGNLNYDNLAIGNENTNGKVSSILTFNTEAIPDNAVITSARLFLTRSSVSGQNPLSLYGNNLVELDVKSGFFGSSSAIEASDFTANADAVNIGCVLSTAPNNNYKIRIEIPDTMALQYINKTGLTQFKLNLNAYDAQASNVIYFYGSNIPGNNAPILDVKYSLNVNVSTHDKNMNVSMYPNPANEFIYLHGNDLESVEIWSIEGKFLLKQDFYSDFFKVDTSQLQAGFYFIKVKIDNNVISKKLIIS